jgi:hypothetical protein
MDAGEKHPGEQLAAFAANELASEELAAAADELAVAELNAAEPVLRSLLPCEEFEELEELEVFVEFAASEELAADAEELAAVAACNLAAVPQAAPSPIVCDASAPWIVMLCVPAVSDPAKSMSHAVIVTAPLLLITVFVAATVNVPSEPVLSQSALITNPLPALTPFISDAICMPAPASSVNLPLATTPPLRACSVIMRFATKVSPSLIAI